MVDCPKCGETDLVWVKTKNQKNWLKKDLGDGQVSRGWHNCEAHKIQEINHKLRRFCHECKTKIIGCADPDCKLCVHDNSFCPQCDAHVSVVDMK